MFCTSCGNRLNEGERFCTKCGTKVVSYEAENLNNRPAAEPVMNDNYATYVTTSGTVARSSAGGIKKGVICALAALVVIITGLLLFFGLHKTTVDVEDFVKIEYSGSNHYGKAETQLDKNSLIAYCILKGRPENDTWKELKKQLKKASGSKDSLGDIMSDIFDSGKYSGAYYSGDMNWYYDMMSAAESITLQQGKEEGLSNGDDIEVTLIYADDMLSDYKIKLKGSKKTEKVKDLPEANEVDPFEKISVEFDGISPNVSADVICGDDEIFDYIYASIEGNSSGLSIGDKVKVELTVDENGLLEDMGIHLTGLSKEYVCENVDAYIDSASQIPDDVMERMRSNADDFFRANAASNWDSSVSIKGYNLVGNYFLKAKRGNGWVSEPNQIFLVFKATVKKEGEKKFSYYHYVKYSNIILLKDGTCSVDLSNYSAPSDGWFSDEGFEKYDLRFAGFLKLDSLFNNCVTTQIDEYEYENNVGDGSANNASNGDKNEEKNEEKNEDEESGQETTGGDYILPTSDSVKLTKDDIKDLSLKELNYAKNEIYARHGRKFDSPELRAYFESKSWYKGTIDATDFSDNMLSEVEKANAALLKEMEYTMAPNGYQLDQ